MDIYCGAKIKLLLKNNDVMIGFINSINTNEEDSIVALSTSEIWPNGNQKSKTRLPGVQRIHASSIEELEILPETEPGSFKKRKGKMKVRNMLSSKTIPLHLSNLTELEQEKLVFGADKPRKGSNSALSGDDELIKTVFKGEGKNSDDDSIGEVEDSYTTAEFTVLSKTDQLFHDSIRFIAERPVIGFAAEGVDIGRDGKLCWIQIDAGGSIFLFDMLSLREDGFKHGLRRIVQCDTILKVVHDCRLISDLLFHQYEIQMINIFDTQVAHVLAYREQNRKDLPRYVPGLASCLFEHLDLPEEQIHVIRVREQAKSEDQESWAERPAPYWLLDAASKHVKHLLDLRMILMEKMMVEFIAGVEIYLTYVRNASDKEAKDSQGKRHLLPIAFQHLPNFVSDLTRRMKYNYGKKRNDIRRKDKHGFTENRIKISDPKIVVSKDSIWHAKVDKREKKSSKQPPEKFEKKLIHVDTEEEMIQDVENHSSNSKVTETMNDIPPEMKGKVEEVIEIQNDPSSRKEDQFVKIKEKYFSESVYPTKLFENGTSAKDSDSVSSSSNSESDTVENGGSCTRLSDSAFMEQISSRAEMCKQSPSSSNIFSNVRNEIHRNKTNHLHGMTMTFLPAGLMQDNLKKSKSYEENYYDQLYLNEPMQHSEISGEEEERDYGEIPTPQRLGRAGPKMKPLFPLLKDQSMSMSSTSSSSSITSNQNGTSPIKRNNSCASLDNDIIGTSTTNHLLHSNNIPTNFNDLRDKLFSLKQRSNSSASSVASTDSSTGYSRHQQLVELLKSPK